MMLNTLRRIRVELVKKKHANDMPLEILSKHACMGHVLVTYAWEILQLFGHGILSCINLLNAFDKQPFGDQYTVKIGQNEPGFPGNIIP